MSTKAEQIAEAIQALLLAAPQTPAGTRVYRSRAVLDQELRGAVPAIAINKASDLLHSESVGQTRWLLTVEVAVLARGDDPDAAVDPTLEAVHGKMYADRTLGGLALDVTAGSAQYVRHADPPEACTVVREYRVLYQTTEAGL